MEFDKIYITKRIVSGIIGYGTSKIVHQVIKNNTEIETTRDWVGITSTRYLAAYVAADMSKTYTDAKIDEIVDWWKKNIVITEA